MHIFTSIPVTAFRVAEGRITLILTPQEELRSTIMEHHNFTPPRSSLFQNGWKASEK